MVRYVLKQFFVLILVCASLACRHTPPTITTPQGTVAYQLEDAIDIVNALQHEAILANRAGKLSDRSTRLVIDYRRVVTGQFDKAIAAGTGKTAAMIDATNALRTLEEVLAAHEKQALAAAMASVRTVLLAVGGM